MLSKLLELIAPPLCVACGWDAGRATPLCRACRARMVGGGFTSVAGSAFRCWTAFTYDGPAGAVVRGLKFGGRTLLADLMAAQLAALAPAAVMQGTLVPVPVHPGHRRRRGVDHALELTRALSRRTGLPVADCLCRRGDPRPQVGRGRSERIGGPLGSITVADGAVVPARAVVVDDVVTTGATLAACIGALRPAGCREFSLIAYARAAAR